MGMRETMTPELGWGLKEVPGPSSSAPRSLSLMGHPFPPHLGFTLPVPHLERLTSWVCDLGNCSGWALHSEGPSLGLMLCCDILNHFKQGALHFHFVLGSADYVAHPACVENGVSKLREESCLEIIYGTLGLLPITGSEGLLALGKDQFW